MKYTKTSPCDNCPFRSDKPFLLGRGRVREIQAALQRGDFPCHKTTVDCEDDEGCNRVSTEKSLHCAGALILLEKIEEPSQMMRICERLGLYDRTKLNIGAPVYDSWDEMVEGCS